MCESCFQNEFFFFNSSEEFDKLDLELTKKLGRHEMKYIKNISLGYAKMGYNVYKCKSCEEKWCLSDPDHAWRGFFISEEHVEDHLANTRKSDKLITRNFLILLILVTAIITAFWLL